MSVERLNFIRHGDCDGGELCSMEQSIHGSYVAYTDYQRHCIKGRCGGCRNIFHTYDCAHCRKNGRINISLGGYCDEFEPREAQ